MPFSRGPSKTWGMPTIYHGLSKVLAQVRAQRTSMTLMTPVWKSQLWYTQNCWKCCPIYSSNSNRKGHNQSITDEPTSSCPAAGRLEHLARRFLNKSISEEGTELLLSQWRQKSARFCDSLFRKWVCWCDQRYCFPVSGPTNEVRFQLLQTL